MNRTFFRFASVAVLLLAISFVMIPTAEARELGIVAIDDRVL